MTTAIGEDFLWKRVISTGFFEQIQRVGDGLAMKDVHADSEA